MSIDRDIREIKEAIRIIAYNTPFETRTSGDWITDKPDVHRLKTIVRNWEDRKEVTKAEMETAVEKAYIEGVLKGKQIAKEEMEGES